jgi:membrane protein implicated in regulation of membrane protease activity
MLNERGEALAPIASGQEGSVLVRGEVWRAMSHEPIAKGDRVRVAHVHGLTLTVRKD